MFMFCNKATFLRRGVVNTSPNPKLEDDNLSGVVATLYNGGRLSIRNTRKPHALVTATHLSRIF